jgi:hypothetical protein
MLFLFQVPPQTIHVTVQQPPGLPFWETAIISAVAGTFFGFASNLAMEFVKPAISSWLLKQTILKNLDEEFRQNYRAVLEAIELMRDYDSVPDAVKEDKVLVIEAIAGSITKERFTHFKETNKALFYEADQGERLGKFYVLVEVAFNQFPKNRNVLHIAAEFGEQHAQLRNLTTIKPSGIFMEAFKAMRPLAR